MWTKAATSDVHHSLAAVVGSKAVVAMKHIERNSLQPSVCMQMCCDYCITNGLETNSVFLFQTRLMVVTGKSGNFVKS